MHQQNHKHSSEVDYICYSRDFTNSASQKIQLPAIHNATIINPQWPDFLVTLLTATLFFIFTQVSVLNKPVAEGLDYHFNAMKILFRQQTRGVLLSLLDLKCFCPYLDGFGSSLLVTSSSLENGFETDQFPRE